MGLLETRQVVQEVKALFVIIQRRDLPFPPRDTGTGGAEAEEGRAAGI